MGNEIKKYLSEFECAFFDEALNVFNINKNNIFTLSLFSLALREIIRLFLERISNDSEVILCSWYKDEMNSRNEKSTRRQKMIYAICGGFHPKLIKEEFGIDLYDLTAPLRERIDKLSKYTHLNIDILNVEIDYQNEFNETLSELLNFLKSITDFRKMFWEKVSSALIQEGIQEYIDENVIDEIDILATHYEDPDFCLNSIEILKIDPFSIFTKVHGSINVVHQFGSDSDVDSDDGARFDANYNCDFELEIPIVDDIKNILDGIELQDIRLNVDTFLGSDFE